MIYDKNLKMIDYPPLLSKLDIGLAKEIKFRKYMKLYEVCTEKCNLGKVAVIKNIFLKINEE